MASDHPPTIDPVAARRWQQLPQAAAPWLHEEVARRMAERLPWIRLPVKRWANWEPLRGGRHAADLVAAQYPGAERLDVVAWGGHEAGDPPARAAPWWRRWRGGSRGGRGIATVSAPPAASMDLVWANMLAHHVADPGALMASWREALAPDGFLMFSCFGPDTLRELRALHAGQGWPPPAQDFTDMHDWGDQLARAGFADPVMDMEHITLGFETPQRLLAELRGLGRNLHPERFGGLRTRSWRARLQELLTERLRPGEGGQLTLTFEIIYGHALKPSAQRTPHESFTVHRTRASLDGGALVPGGH